MQPPAGLEQAIRALSRPGGVVLYPTSTVYGIGGRAHDAASALRIAEIKGRPPGGLIVLALEPELQGDLARRLADRFWPGPLTLVVPAWPGLAAEVLAPDGTVAVRPPLHPMAQALVRAVGPITSTSANPTGVAPPRRPADVTLPVDAVVDAGMLPPSPASTIVRADTGELLREGAIPDRAIAALLAGGLG